VRLAFPPYRVVNKGRLPCGGREGEMKAILWTISIAACVLFGLADVMNYVGSMF
jgi:hypothetical protein